MSTPYNPYQPPEAKVDDVPDGADAHAEVIRRDHIKHEASIKAVGTLYYLSTLGLLVSGVMSIFVLASGTDVPQGMGGAILGVVMLVFGVLMFLVARGLRKLSPWVRIPTALFSAVGLLGFPFGTLINAYIMWVVLSAKGRFILSPDYAAIVAATPQVKYRTSIVVWIFLGLIVLLLVAAVVVPMFSKS